MTFTVDPAALRRAAGQTSGEAADLRTAADRVSHPDAGGITRLVSKALDYLTGEVDTVAGLLDQNARGLTYVAFLAETVDGAVRDRFLQTGGPLWS